MTIAILAQAMVSAGCGVDPLPGTTPGQFTTEGPTPTDNTPQGAMSMEEELAQSRLILNGLTGLDPVIDAMLALPVQELADMQQDYWLFRTPGIGREDEVRVSHFHGAFFIQDPAETGMLVNFEDLLPPREYNLTFGPSVAEPQWWYAMGERRFAKRIVNAEGKFIGMMELNPRGASTLALDWNGDRIADFIHGYLSDGTELQFVSQTGRLELEDADKYVVDPLCDPELMEGLEAVAGDLFANCPNRGDSESDGSSGGGSGHWQGTSPGQMLRDLACDQVNGPMGSSIPSQVAYPFGEQRGDYREYTRKDVQQAVAFAADLQAILPDSEFTRAVVAWAGRLFETFRECDCQVVLVYDPVATEPSEPKDDDPDEGGAGAGGNTTDPIDPESDPEALSRLCELLDDDSKKPLPHEQYPRAVNNECDDPLVNPDPTEATADDPLAPDSQVEINCDEEPDQYDLNDVIGGHGGCTNPLTDPTPGEGGGGDDQNCTGNYANGLIIGGGNVSISVSLGSTIGIEICDPRICDPRGR